MLRFWRKTKQSLTFAAVHVSLSPNVRAAIRERVTTMTPYDPEKFLATMFASAQRAHAGCRKVVLSDRGTSFAAAAPFEVIRCDINADEPMLSRLQAWAILCEQANGHVVLIDNDVLVARSLAHVFEERFDVGLTYRRHEWPINTGVQFVHGRALDKGARFYRRAAEHLLQGAPDGRLWLGDRAAIRDAVHRADFTRNDTYIHRQDGFRVKLLPCERYNFSPSLVRTADEHREAFTVHFKGPRKPLMIPYWEAHLAASPLQEADPRGVGT